MQTNEGAAMTKAAHSSELTREQVEAFRRIAKEHFGGVRVDQVCDLALRALPDAETPRVEQDVTAQLEELRKPAPSAAPTEVDS